MSFSSIVGVAFSALAHSYISQLLSFDIIINFSSFVAWVCMCACECALKLDKPTTRIESNNSSSCAFFLRWNAGCSKKALLALNEDSSWFSFHIVNRKCFTSILPRFEKIFDSCSKNFCLFALSSFSLTHFTHTHIQCSHRPTTMRNIKFYRWKVEKEMQSTRSKRIARYIWCRNFVMYLELFLSTALFLCRTLTKCRSK